ncbi:MAG: hypothetical protein EHM56_08425, partial [Chloroflexi bacterium]
MDEQKRLSRNDPCWCGSGRLYKHCHRREDMAAEKEAQKSARAARASEQAWQEIADEPAFGLPIPSLSPQLATSQARPQQVEASDLETQIAELQDRLESGEVDAIDAFEMSEKIRHSLLSGSQAGGRQRYAELVRTLRDRAPELYDEEGAYFTWNLLEDALAEERWEALPELLADMISYPDLDPFFANVLDALMYHGQFGVLRQAMEELWRRRESVAEEAPDWDQDALIGDLLLARFYEYMDTARQPRPDDPVLLQPKPYDLYTP